MDGVESPPTVRLIARGKRVRSSGAYLTPSKTSAEPVPFDKAFTAWQSLVAAHLPLARMPPRPAYGLDAAALDHALQSLEARVWPGVCADSTDEWVTALTALASAAPVNSLSINTSLYLPEPPAVRRALRTGLVTPTAQASAASSLCESAATASTTHFTDPGNDTSDFDDDLYLTVATTDELTSSAAAAANAAANVAAAHRPAAGSSFLPSEPRAIMFAASAAAATPAPIPAPVTWSAGVPVRAPRQSSLLSFVSYRSADRSVGTGASSSSLSLAAPVAASPAPATAARALLLPRPPQQQHPHQQQQQQCPLRASESSAFRVAFTALADCDRVVSAVSVRTRVPLPLPRVPAPTAATADRMNDDGGGSGSRSAGGGGNGGSNGDDCDDDEAAAAAAEPQSPAPARPWHVTRRPGRTWELRSSRPLRLIELGPLRDNWLGVLAVAAVAAVGEEAAPAAAQQQQQQQPAVGLARFLTGVRAPSAVTAGAAAPVEAPVAAAATSGLSGSAPLCLHTVFARWVGEFAWPQLSMRLGAEGPIAGAGGISWSAAPPDPDTVVSVARVICPAALWRGDGGGAVEAAARALVYAWSGAGPVAGLCAQTLAEDLASTVGGHLPEFGDASVTRRELTQFRLLDTNKQSHVTQLSLLDLFARMSLSARRSQQQQQQTQEHDDGSG